MGLLQGSRISVLTFSIRLGFGAAIGSALAVVLVVVLVLVLVVLVVALDALDLVTVMTCSLVLKYVDLRVYARRELV